MNSSVLSVNVIIEYPHSISLGTMFVARPAFIRKKSDLEHTSLLFIICCQVNYSILWMEISPNISHSKIHGLIVNS